MTFPCTILCRKRFTLHVEARTIGSVSGRGERETQSERVEGVGEDVYHSSFPSESYHAIPAAGGVRYDDW